MWSHHEDRLCKRAIEAGLLTPVKGYELLTCDNTLSSTMPVGGKAPNELGLYDMSGNVEEWLWDIYQDYTGSSKVNPRGAIQGECRTLRGGAWDLDMSYCTVSYRGGNLPTIYGHILGLRVCKSI